METTAKTTRIGILALATLIAAIAIPVAAASGSQSDPGLVARRLGSPDPREHVTTSHHYASHHYALGIVAGRLGSPDPRETAAVSTASSAVANTLGSPDPRDTAFTVNRSSPGNGTFHWGDFGIGLGFGIGLAAILVGAGLLAAVAVRGKGVAQPLA